MKTLRLILTALAFCTVLLPAQGFAAKPLPLEEKYAIKGFENLKWKVLPAEMAETQKLEDGEWSLVNLGGMQMLLLADYEERDIAVTCDITFPRIVHTGDSVSFFFNYKYYDYLGRSSFTQLRITPNGKYSFGQSDGAHMVVQQEGAFPLERDNPRHISLYAAKLRNGLFIALNKQQSAIKIGVEAEQGGFGFALPPGTSAKLSKFRFTVYKEISHPFEGVDVISLFAPKTSSGLSS
jgi:hypothetical protein